MGNIFDSYFDKYDSWYEKNHFTYLSEVEAIKRLLPVEGTGFEIGAGTGRFASLLGIKFGLDPSFNMLKKAKARGIKASAGTGENLPFKPGIFDYAAVIIAICFVKEPLQVLKEAFRVLKPEGEILVGIVDKDSFLGKFYLQKDSIFYKYADFFSVNQIVGLLKSAGFGEFSFSQTIFDFPSNILQIEEPQPGFGKGGFVVVKAKKNNKPS